MLDSNRLVVVLCVAIVLSTGLPNVVAATTYERQTCEGETWSGVDRAGGGDIEVRYLVTFNQKEKRICMFAKNTGEMKTFARVSLSVDGTTIPIDDRGELKPGENVSATRNLTSWIDVTAENHSVTVGTYAGTAEFNFTQRIDESREGGIPSPHIEKIDVIRDRASGETFLEVTVVNPGNRTYVPNLMVETFETQTRTPFPNSTGDHTIKYRTTLTESPSDTIVGDLKLFDDWRLSDGKFDRIEFVSKPSGELQSWETELKEVPSLREINGEYYYENESARKFRGPDVKPISETASRVGAGLTVALLVGGLWYRHRRKYR